MNLMNLHQIDIPDGYSGTVEVSEGDLKLEFPAATLSGKMKRYNLHLLTPERKNIEFDLLRFQNDEWCDYKYLQLQQGLTINPELIMAAKREIRKMNI